MAFGKATGLLALLCALAIVNVDAQDVSRLLQNKAIVDKEILCVLRRGPCDVIGRTLQRTLPLALKGCRGCTPQQAQASKQIIPFMQKNYPEEWAQIQRMYA